MTYKFTMVVLVSSLFLSACSSKKIVRPIKQETVKGMQKEYEHIPKPSVNIKPSIGEQREEFKIFLKDTFQDMDSYKSTMRKKLNTGKVRYGKNKITYPAQKKTEKSKNRDIRLYPKIKKTTKIKYPLYKDM